MANAGAGGYVLVVDDNDEVRGMLCETLAQAGHAVRGVRLAAQALDAVMQGPPPAVILLDLVMPHGEMSGIDALFALRRSGAGVRIPVIVMSGIGDLVDTETMQYLNVHATMVKPFSATAILEQVASVARASSTSSGSSPHDRGPRAPFS